MKISIYKGREGVLSALVQASVGKGRPPVVLQGITRENVREKILPLVVKMRQPKEAEQTKPL